MKVTKKVLAVVFAITMVLGLVPLRGENVEAASYSFIAHSAFPVIADGYGRGFNGEAYIQTGTKITSNLDGWTAVYAYNVTGYYWEYVYGGKKYTGNLTKQDRKDVKGAIPGYTSYTGFKATSTTAIDLSKIPSGKTVVLKIYAKCSPAVSSPGLSSHNKLIGSYNVHIVNKGNVGTVAEIAKNEFSTWNNTSSAEKPRKLTEMKTNYLHPFGLSVNEAWCAAFASYCVNQAGLSNMINGGSAWVPDLKAACTNRGGYVSTYPTTSTSAIQNALKKVKAGDLVFFVGGQKNVNEPHHVGIVTSVNVTNCSITYVDGNSNNGTMSNRTQRVLDRSDLVGTILGFGLLH